MWCYMRHNMWWSRVKHLFKLFDCGITYIGSERFKGIGQNLEIAGGKSTPDKMCYSEVEKLIITLGFLPSDAPSHN